MDKAHLPNAKDLLDPVLQAVSDSGGSASISEIVDMVIKREDLTDEQQAVMHGAGP